MEGEEVVVKLDAVSGKVVRVEFDGKIDSGNEEETTVAFFGVAAGVDKDGRTYNIELENEEGSESYDFAKSSDAESDAKGAYANGFDATGSFGWAELDEDGKVAKLALIADYEGKLSSDANVPYGDDAEEYYAIVEYAKASFDDETSAIVNVDDEEDLVKVNDSTVLVRLVFDDKGTNKVSDDEYRVEFEEGLEALEEVKEEYAVVIYDNDSSFVRAKYVLVWSDTSDKSDNLVAKVVSPDEGTVYVGGSLIDLETEDGETTTATIAEGTKDLSLFELVVYTITTNSKDKEIFNFIAGLHEGELTASNEKHGYVGECLSDRVFLLDDDKAKEVDLDSEEYEDYADFMVVVVDVDLAEGSEDQYEVSSFETTTFEDGALVEGDRISIREDEEIVFVIRGMELREEEAAQ